MTVAATDPEGQPLNFTITSGNDAGLFSIDDAGVVRTTAPLDAETTALHTLVINMSDGPNQATTPLPITVNNIDEAPLPATAPDLAVAKGTSGTIINIASLHDDPEGLQVTVPSGGFTSLNGLTISTDGSSVTYQQDGSETTTDMVTYIVEDPAGTSSLGR